MCDPEGCATVLGAIGGGTPPLVDPNLRRHKNHCFVQTFWGLYKGGGGPFGSGPDQDRPPWLAVGMCFCIPTTAYTARRNNLWRCKYSYTRMKSLPRLLRKYSISRL